MTMDEQKAYASDIAAEAVGERLGSPPSDTEDLRNPRITITTRAPLVPPFLFKQDPSMNRRTPMTTRSYRAEFFTAADYAASSFEAETPQQHWS
jgi:hypothetical protein